MPPDATISSERKVLELGLSDGGRRRIVIRAGSKGIENSCTRGSGIGKGNEFGIEQVGVGLQCVGESYLLHRFW